MILALIEKYIPIIIAIALLPVFIYFQIVGITFQTGSGNHTGIITAIDTSWIFVKSTTVYFKTDVNSSQEDSYCLKDESLLPSLRALQDSKQVVTLSYNEYLENWIECSIYASHVITSVK